jgi:hypothetical protein
VISAGVLKVKDLAILLTIAMLTGSSTCALAGYKAHGDPPNQGPDASQLDLARDVLRDGRKRAAAVIEEIDDLARQNAKLVDYDTATTAQITARQSITRTKETMGKVRESLVEVLRTMESNETNAAKMAVPAGGTPQQIAIAQRTNAYVDSLLATIKQQEATYQAAEKRHAAVSKWATESEGPREVRWAAMDQSWKALFQAQTQMLTTRLRLTEHAIRVGGETAERKLMLDLAGVSGALRGALWDGLPGRTPLVTWEEHFDRQVLRFNK